MRASLRAWFRPRQVDEEALSELDQIVTELVENAVEHTYGGSSGPVTVRADLDPTGLVTLQVRDQGTWRPPRRDVPAGGLGQALVQQLSAAFSLDHEDGTEVTVRLRPWKRSHRMVPSLPNRDTTVADVYVQELEEQKVLHLTGPVDAALLEEVTAQLALCTKPGAPDLVIDLDKVTMLSSAVIGALRESVRRAAESGVKTSVRCRPGTVAQQVLALAAVPTVSYES